jgi:hypothetical protein
MSLCHSHSSRIAVLGRRLDRCDPGVCVVSLLVTYEWMLRGSDRPLIAKVRTEFVHGLVEHQAVLTSKPRQRAN